MQCIYWIQIKMESHKTNKSSVSCPCHTEIERTWGDFASTQEFAFFFLSLSLCYTRWTFQNSMVKQTQARVLLISELYGWTNTNQSTPPPHTLILDIHLLFSCSPTENNHFCAMNKNIQWAILLSPLIASADPCIKGALSPCTFYQLILNRHYCN